MKGKKWLGEENPQFALHCKVKKKKYAGCSIKKLSTQHAREGPPEIAVYKMCNAGSLKSLECKTEILKNKI